MLGPLPGEIDSDCSGWDTIALVDLADEVTPVGGLLTTKKEATEQKEEETKLQLRTSWNPRGMPRT